MKRLGKIISTVLAASMVLSNVAYAGELADTSDVSTSSASFLSYAGDKIKNTVSNMLITDESSDNSSDESVEPEFQDPGMELDKDDILKLYDMGYELDDIEEAVKLSSVQNKTPYELLQTKGKTKYIPHEIETTEQMNANSIDGENINVQPEYDFTVDEKSWSDALIELNGVDTNIDENQWEWIKLSGIDKYIDESMLTDEEKTELSSIDLNNETETMSVAEASTNIDFEDIYNNNIFPNSVHEITQQGAYSTYNDVAVNDLTGNVVVSATDVSLPGRNGLDLNLTRYYSAIDAADADASVYKKRGSYSNQIIDYYAVIVHPYVTITYNQPLADGSTTKSFYVDRVFIAPDRINYNHYPSSTNMFKLGMFVSEEAFNEQLQRMYDEGEAPSYMFTDANCEETCKAYAANGYYNYTINMPAESKISKIEYEIEEDMIDSTAYPDCEVTVWNNSYYDDINEPIHDKYFKLGAGWSFDFPYIEKRYDSNEYVTYEYLHMGSGGVWQIEDNQLNDYYLNDMQLESGSGSVNGESCEYILTQKDGKKYYFGTVGQLLQIKDRYDNAISFEYNIIADGRFDYPQLKKITDTVGRTIDIAYTENKVIITVTDKNDSSQNRVIEYTKGTLDNQSILSSVKDGQGYITNYEYYTDMFEVSMLDKKFTSDCSKINYALLSAVNYPNGLRTDFVYSSMEKNCGISGVMEIPICGRVSRYDYNIDWEDYDYTNTSEICYSMQNGKNNKSFVYDGYPTFRGISEVPDEYRTYTHTRERVDRYNSNYKEITTTYHVSDNDTLLKESVTIQCNISRPDDQESKYQTSVTDYTYNAEDLCTQETTRYYNDYETDKNTYITTKKQYTYDSGKYGDLLSVKINDNNNYKTEYTYDSTYHLPLTTTYKKDTNSTIVERNELTSDKKSVASLTVTDNNSTKLKREYMYDGYGNITTEKRYIGNGNWSDYAEITYNYEDSRNVSNKINGVYPSKITVSGMKDADDNQIDSISKSYQYDWYGNVISETDSNNKTYTYTYDKLNRLTAIKNPDNSEKTYTYNVALGRNEIIEKDENGNEKLTAYDNYGRVIKEKDITNDILLSEHSRKDMGYEFAWEDVVYSTQNGKTITRTIIDNLGQTKEKQVLDANENIIFRELYDYDFAVNGVLSVITTTTYGENESQNVKKKSYTDIYGNVAKEEVIYNDGNDVKTAITSYTYDYLGNVKTVREPRAYDEGWSEDEYTAKYEYDAFGNVTKETDINNNSIVNTYDGMGNLVSVKDKDGNVATNTYDVVGRLIKEKVPFQKNGLSTVYAENKYYYDANGNVIKSQTANNAVGSSTTYTTTEYQYNWQNQPTKVKGFNGDEVESCVQYYYDSVGNVLRMYTGDVDNLVINGLDNVSGSNDYAVTKYAYDSMNRCISQTDALGQTVTNTYDINGNLISATDRNGNTLSYSYDGLNQLLSKSSSKTTADTYTYSYNMKGNRTGMTGGGVDTTSVYDNLGRLTKESLTDGTVKEYTYDINGNRKSFKLTKDNAVQYTLTYDYDKMNRLTKVYEDGAEKAAYEYNDDGTLKKASYGSQTTDYSYNLANLLTEVNNANGSTQISQYSYTYYVDGNQKSKTESVDGSNKGTTNYTYDGLNRLVQEQTPDKTYSYQYDSYGNRSQLSVTGDESYTTSYSYDKNNRLRNQTKTAGNVSEITDYWYDPNGNQISSMTVTTGTEEDAGVGIESAGGDTNSINEYDSWNQLTKTMQNGKTASYTYNGDGLRMSKTVDGTTTSHIWDGTNIAGDVTNGTVTKYIRGLQLISSKKGSSESFYNYNGHGDVVQLTNGSGSITKQYSYDAFGVEQNKDVNDTNPFRYCGEYYDTETNSMYLRARYYKPTTGRFINEDPIKDGFNWYSYCESDPVNSWDQFGLFKNGDQYLTPEHVAQVFLYTMVYYAGVKVRDNNIRDKAANDAQWLRNSDPKNSYHFGLASLYDINNEANGVSVGAAFILGLDRLNENFSFFESEVFSSALSSVFGDLQGALIENIVGNAGGGDSASTEYYNFWSRIEDVNYYKENYGGYIDIDVVITGTGSYINLKYTDYYNGVYIDENFFENTYGLAIMYSIPL